MDIGTRPGRDRAAPFDDIRARAGACTDCDLRKRAVPASLMLMGEQPGDHEDREGRPFVGPAGKLLDEALTDASIDRSAVYLTNAVKHFAFVKGRNARTRIHKTPTRTEVAACRPWWELEFRVSRPRAQPFELPGGVVAIATIHPAAVLRTRAGRADVYAGFVENLVTIASYARGKRQGS